MAYCPDMSIPTESLEMDQAAVDDKMQYRQVLLGTEDCENYQLKIYGLGGFNLLKEDYDTYQVSVFDNRDVMVYTGAGLGTYNKASASGRQWVANQRTWRTRRIVIG